MLQMLVLVQSGAAGKCSVTTAAEDRRSLHNWEYWQLIVTKMQYCRYDVRTNNITTLGDEVFVDGD